MITFLIAINLVICFIIGIIHIVPPWWVWWENLTIKYAVTHKIVSLIAFIISINNLIVLILLSGK